MHSHAFFTCVPKPENEYMGITGSPGSRHCIALIRLYMARLTAFVAEQAGVKPEAIGDYEQFIPWITAKDALCIEALHWYYLNFAAIIVKPATYDTLLWHLANAKIERHPFCTCMTMGQPMLEKVVKASSAAAFNSTTGKPAGGEAVPADGGSSAGYSEYRHGYNQRLING